MFHQQIARDPREAEEMAEKLIIDVHKEFLKRATQILLKVRDGDVQFLQSFVISMIIRDLWTRNHAIYKTAEEAKAVTKEELYKLCEPIGLQLDELEKFMEKVTKGGIL